MTDLELGESAERFLKNKVNALHLDKWSADIFPNKDSKKQNHKEGDLFFIYNNGGCFNCLIKIGVESKASAKHQYGLINVNFKHIENDVEKDIKDINTYLSGLTHDFYISVGKYNSDLENDISAEFHYTLFRTIRFVNLMLKDNCKYCLKNKESKDPNKADYILIRKFIKDIPTYETNSIQNLLNKIEEFILNNKEIIQEKTKQTLF